MRSAGYTLIELLVVISIIGILSVVAFVNIKDFSSAQALKKAAGDVQSFLRLAQSNATSSTVCPVLQPGGISKDVGGVSWTVVFKAVTDDKSTIDIICGQNTPYKTLTLQSGITISSSCSLPFSVVYSALKGVPSLSDASCWTNGDVTIILVNSKGDTKNLILTSGGAINVQ